MSEKDDASSPLVGGALAALPQRKIPSSAGEDAAVWLSRAKLKLAQVMLNEKVRDWDAPDTEAARMSVRAAHKRLERVYVSKLHYKTVSTPVEYSPVSAG
jgi:hypothetical protein